MPWIIWQKSVQLKQFVETIREPIAREMRDWREEVKLFGGQGRQVLLCRGTSLAQPKTSRWDTPGV